MTVRCTRYGVVVVDGRTVAPEVHAPWPVEELVVRVRVRTPDEWWVWAYEVLEAEDVISTGGPLGYGVDYFADDLGVALPPEVREEIQAEVYEEVADLISRRVDEHRHAMNKALDWEAV